SMMNNRWKKAKNIIRISNSLGGVAKASADEEEFIIKEKALKLQSAVRDGDERLVKVIVERSPKDIIEIIQMPVGNAGSAIHVSAAAGQDRILKMLLNETNNNFGLTVNCAFFGGDPRLNIGAGADFELKMAPIHFAAYHNRATTVTMLLSHGENPDHQDSWLRTAAHIAAAQGHDHILRLIVAAKGNINIQDLDGRPPLHLACLGARSATVSCLLEIGADANLINHNGITTLHLAAMYGLQRTADLLLQRGADINAKTKNGDTPLMMGLKSEWNKKSSEKVLRFSKLMVFKQADINIPNMDNEYPIHIVAERDYRTLMQSFLQRNPRINVQNHLGETCLHIALRHKYVVMARMIIAYRDVLLNIQDNKGDTPLHIAASDGNTEIVKLLLKHNARADLLNADQNSTLHVAVKSGNNGMVEAILNAEVDKDLFDKDGRAALHIAIIQKHQAISRKLIERGASVNLPTKPNESTPLHLAASKGLHNVIVNLCAKGADVNMKDKRGSLPIHRACMFGHVEAVSALLTRNSNINTKMGRAGSTPLFIAIEKNDTPIVRLLLANGANANIQGVYEGPLHKAVKVKNIDIVSALVDHRADINATGCFDQTPLHCAAGSNELDIVDIIMEHGGDLEAKDCNDKTPLDIAKEAETEDMIFLLRGRLNIKTKFDEAAE
ncbi:unnamed protein product, partial [Owenia fusiformis]